MLGDHSRDTGRNARRRGYAAVRLKQGAPLLDATFNEQADIARNASRDVGRAALGRFGTPRGDTGFAISAGSAGGLTIGAGAFWIDGERVRNDTAIGLAAQVAGASLPTLAQRLPLLNQQGLAFLEVWYDVEDAIDLERLREVALNGIDDATRLRLRWRVDVAPLATLGITADEIVAATRDCADLDIAAWQPSTGMMAADLADPAAVADLDCELPPEAGYRSQENQLYAAVVHDPGNRNNATFKWSREGGGIVAGLRRDTDGRVVLDGAIDDDRLGFHTGDIVEVVDDLGRAQGLPGSLHRLALDPVTGEATFTPNLPAAQFDALVGPKLIRWDMTIPAPNAPAGIPLDQAPQIELENGVVVSFANGTYRTGDTWLVPARSATGALDWPPYDPPDASQGGADFYRPLREGRRRAPLALVTRRSGGVVEIEDVRPVIPTLACLTADDVRVDGSPCQFPADVLTVQDAIDRLCQMNRGLCNVTVSPGDDVQAAFDSVPAGADAAVCFRPGLHRLPDRIVVRDKGRLLVHGAGAMSRLSGRLGHHGLLFRDCAAVTVQDLSIQVGDPVGPFRGGIDAALEVLNCGPSDIEAVEVRTGSAGHRRIAAIRVARLPAVGAGVETRIARCRIAGGDDQIGIQVLNADRAIVEDNVVQPRPAATGFVYALRLNNRVMSRAMVAAMIRQHQAPSAGPQTRASVRAVGRSSNFYTDTMLLTRWNQLAGRNVPRSIGTDVQFFSYLRNAAATALRDNGDVRIGGSNFPGFRAWFQLARNEAEPTLDTAIEIAGSRIGEARVAGNEVGRCSFGVVVAASTRTQPPDTTWDNTEPPNVVRRAEIAGNVIAVAGDRTVHRRRYGIEVGHFARQLAIRDNEITWTRNTELSSNVGINVHGWRGPMLDVGGNLVMNNFAVDAWFGPSLSQAARGMWRVAGNGMTVATVGAGFIERDNVSPQ